MKLNRNAGVLVLSLYLVACVTSSPEVVQSTGTSEKTVTSPSATLSPAPSSTAMPASTETPPPPTQTPVPTARICAPFPGYSLEDLTAAVNNIYHPPKLGSDDPHQGVDLAMTIGDMALPGDPVTAVFDGMVSGIINDRFPYGNAIMVETPLDSLTPDWEGVFQLPTPAPTLPPHPALTCPERETPIKWDVGKRSLYLLYAHLQKPVDLQLDDEVECGSVIGVIGQSGNALAPHLHLEVRVGPAGARFDSLAHYSGGITLDEMSNYCTWRVSGVFQLVDPMRLLAVLP